MEFHDNFCSMNLEFGDVHHPLCLFSANPAALIKLLLPMTVRPFNKMIMMFVLIAPVCWLLTVIPICDRFSQVRALSMGW